MHSQRITRSVLAPVALRRKAFGQFAVEHPRRQAHSTLARNDQKVHSSRQGRAASPEKFPYLPFDPITDYWVANLAANCNTHAGLAMIGGFSDNDKILGMDLVAESR